MPPPASPRHTTSVNQPTDHVTSSPNPVSSFTPQFPLQSTTAAENNKISNPPMPTPADHSDFINSFLSSHQDFSSPLTSASSTTTPVSSITTSTEEDKSNSQTEYDSFHADFSSFLSEALNEPSQPLSSSSQSGGIMKDSSSVGSTSKEPELPISQGEENHPNGEYLSTGNDDYTAPNITAVQQQSQESAPNTFDSLDNEVSSAQDILSVSKNVCCCSCFNFHYFWSRRLGRRLTNWLFTKILWCS